MGKKNITRPTTVRNVPTGSKFLLQLGDEIPRTMLSIRGGDSGVEFAYRDDYGDILELRELDYAYPVVHQVFMNIGDCTQNMLRDSLIKISETKYSLVSSYVGGVDDCCLLRAVGSVDTYRVVNYKTKVELVNG